MTTTQKAKAILTRRAMNRLANLVVAQGVEDFSTFGVPGDDLPGLRWYLTKEARDIIIALRASIARNRT